MELIKIIDRLEEKGFNFSHEFVKNNEIILQALVDETEQAINYTRCYAQLKDKEVPTFKEWLKDKFIRISDTDYTNKDQDCIWGHYELEDIYKLMN